MANGQDGKLEIVGLQRQHVRFLRPGSPGVDTTQAHLALLDMQLRQRTLHEVATMLSPAVFLARTGIEVFDEVWQSRALEGC